MALGCILGGLKMQAAVNNQVDFNEGGGALGPGAVAAGDYFPHSGSAPESLITAVIAQLDAEGGYTYAAEMNLTTGIVLFSTTGGAWQMLTSTGYEDSVFLELGFPATNPSSVVSGPNNIIYATTPPKGTWFPKTHRDGVDRKWDSQWEYVGNGASSRGPTGKIVGISTGFFRDRSITWSRIVPDDVYGGLVRAQVCFGEHWYQQKVMRIFADRVITGSNYFDGKIKDDSRKNWKPQRHSAAFETYEWTFDFAEAV